MQHSYWLQICFGFRRDDVLEHMTNLRSDGDLVLIGQSVMHVKHISDLEFVGDMQRSQFL